MIGAAGFFRARAGARAGADLVGQAIAQAGACRAALDQRGVDELDPQRLSAEGSSDICAATAWRRASAAARTTSSTARCSRRSSTWPSPAEGRPILEIGPGLGILTAALCSAGAG